jgi:hypothetical protein
MNRVFPRGVRVATWPAWNLQYCAGRPSRLLRETLRNLRCFLPGIAMMETAQAHAGNDRSFRARLVLNRPVIRGVLAETVVNAILMKIGDVFADQPSQMLFV